MTIGIEAERANLAQKSGVEHYAKQLILHLAQIDQANQYVLYLRTQPQEWLLGLPKNFRIKVMPFPIFWTQLRLSWEMLFNPVDVLFIPASALPIIHPKNSVTTIHDLGWKFYPETFTVFMKNFLEWSAKFAVRSAARVIVISEATKNDLIKFYKVDSKKIFLTHLGYDEMFLNEGLKQKMVDGLPEKFILFLSTIQPRKNLEGLIGAFLKLKQEQPELPHKLVVVGRPGWKYEKIVDLLNQHKDQIVWLNGVSDDERVAIVAKASVLVLPSFYEGFGLTILEAFAAGTPVATANVSSMPEVAAEAAVYFDPKNADDIKSALRKILFDESLRQNLVEKGKERLKNFSWQKCAQETLKVLTN